MGPKGLPTSYRTRRRASRAGFASGEHQPGGGLAGAGNAFAVTDAAAHSRLICANVSASSIGSFATLKDVSASNACFDAPLVNVVVEQKRVLQQRAWFSDRASPARPGVFARRKL